MSYGGFEYGGGGGFGGGDGGGGGMNGESDLCSEWRCLSRKS